MEAGVPAGHASFEGGFDPAEAAGNATTKGGEASVPAVREGVVGRFGRGGIPVGERRRDPGVRGPPRGPPLGIDDRRQRERGEGADRAGVGLSELGLVVDDADPQQAPDFGAGSAPAG